MPEKRPPRVHWDSGRIRGLIKVTERQREAAELRANGASLSDLAERYGVGVATVSRWVHDVYLSDLDLRNTLRASK